MYTTLIKICKNDEYRSYGFVLASAVAGGSSVTVTVGDIHPGHNVDIEFPIPCV